MGIMQTDAFQQCCTSTNLKDEIDLASNINQSIRYDDLSLQEPER